jgi:hypothetical protein
MLCPFLTEPQLTPRLHSPYSCVFSANGASSLKAWGIAPGLGTESPQSAEGATQGIGMNRAFSAGVGIVRIPGALPQAKMSTAPLALNRYLPLEERENETGY